jgi:hypothetical protein
VELFQGESMEIGRLDIVNEVAGNSSARLSVSDRVNIWTKQRLQL